MSGGTTKTVGVVTQADVDAAKNDLLEKDKTTTQKELADRFDQGDYVIQGQVIGLTGGTPSTTGAGNLTTGPHLHLEIYQEGRAINPLTVVPLK